MGAAKQLLDVAGVPMLDRVVAALLAGGVTRVAVVTHRQILARWSPGDDRVHVLVNDDEQTEMIDSIRMGIVAGRDQSKNLAGFLVCPCDAAGVSDAAVRRCVEAFAARQRPIVVASHAGRRGHPVLFDASLADAVLSPACDGGLNQLVRSRPGDVQLVECDDPGVWSNLNTPADLPPTDPGQSSPT
jgi:molybdenum cofactor cytidylyltransferase